MKQTLPFLWKYSDSSPSHVHSLLYCLKFTAYILVSTNCVACIISLVCLVFTCAHNRLIYKSIFFNHSELSFGILISFNWLRMPPSMVERNVSNIFKKTAYVIIFTFSLFRPTQTNIIAFIQERYERKFVKYFKYFYVIYQIALLFFH